MNHLTEEELILHYYGEEGDGPDASRHLEECEACREFYASLQRVLNVVDALPVPDPGPEYGARVWRKIERQLPARRRLAWLPAFPWRWAGAAVAMAGLVVAAFLAGRFYPAQRPRQEAAPATVADRKGGEGVLLVAVGDYLDRTQMVLIELANAKPKGKLDISTQQERAGDLVSESRLYRQTAVHAGDTAVAGVLDEVDRVLLDIAHGPSKVSRAELEQLRERLESQGILFKIRVLGANVKQQQDAAATDQESHQAL